MTGTGKANRLIHATSPYLLQHAHNPVDWYEWGDEALTKARQENKPILVSIGYSSCHWCHVMEREVFEKEDMAALMNKYLVCIKVDREERPDVDQVYMDAVQAMGAHGGWPLNVFLTPDQKPFYGGTYFPPQQWVQVIEGVHRAFTEKRAEVNDSASNLARHLAAQGIIPTENSESSADFREDMDAMYARLENSFDTTWGGLDKAPKFIMPSVWLWLLRYHYLSGHENALHQIVLTLKRIAMGGIYDQVGGGFARYSVDGYWFAPHFEKMLYDNAQLFSLYAEAFAVTGDEEFKTILNETFEWLQGEMMHPEGAFYSALDADSEGVEGKYYVWTKEEIDNIFGESAGLINKYYAVKDEGNWEHGNNILFRPFADEKFLSDNNLDAREWQRALRIAKDKLLAVREKRVHPGLDDKIITSWNAMMVVGLIDVFVFSGDERFRAAAVKAMSFIERELSEGVTLFRSFKGKRSAVRGFLDDYAYTIRACIRLYQATFDEYWLRRAELLTTHTIDNFLDSGDGFFLYSGKHGEKLIASRKELFDNVIPASNSVMAQNLIELAVLLDKAEWKTMATQMVNAMRSTIVAEPNYMSNWGIAYQTLAKGLAEVAFVGNAAEEQSRQFQRHYHPFSVVMGTATTSDLPLLRDKKALDGKSTIYVCYDKACRQPVDRVEQALAELG